MAQFSTNHSWRSAAVVGALAIGLFFGFATQRFGGASAQPAAIAGDTGLARATFAGGCFWCMEPPYDKIDGVQATIAGYIGGTVDSPTYEQVSAGTTGHAEAVQIVYDPAKVSYDELLRIFWRNIDPTTPDRQFCDRGSQYRPAIFFHDEAQHKAALASLETVEKTKPFKQPIRTEIVAAGTFYAAEDYHQDYYLKNPLRYKYYRFNCGRDQRLEQLWGSSP